MSELNQTQNTEELNQSDDDIQELDTPEQNIITNLENSDNDDDMPELEDPIYPVIQINPINQIEELIEHIYPTNQIDIVDLEILYEARIRLMIITNNYPPSLQFLIKDKDSYIESLIHKY